MFDAALMLGVCDKIVPGLLIGALRFGHLPVMFVPAGPMTSGIPNSEKARDPRSCYAEGKVGRDELLEAEAASYHGAGTCTFYGTANSNQMLMEMMGLHLPGASLRQPRHAAARGTHDRGRGARAVELTAPAATLHPGRRGGRRAGDRQRRGRPAGHRRLDQPHPAPGRHGARGRDHDLTWDDFDELSAGRPAARPGLSQRHGRREPLPGRRRHGVRDRASCWTPACCTTTCRPSPGTACGRYRTSRRARRDGELVWQERHRAQRATRRCCARVADPFAADGGLRMLDGNLGRAVIKTSAVKPEHRVVEAPAVVFDDQDDFLRRLQARRAGPATSWRWSASRGRAPTACPSCTS